MTPRYRFLRALGPVALVILAARLIQAGRDLALASEFGASLPVDALLLALVVPALLSSVLGGSLTPTLVPARELVKSHPSRDSALLRRVACRGGLALLIVTVLVATVPSLVASTVAFGFSSQGRELVVELVPILAPIVVFSGVSAFGEAFVLSEGHPALASVSQIVLAGPSAVLLWFGQDGVPIQGVAWAFTLGFGLQALVSVGIALALGLGAVLFRASSDDEPPKILGQYVALVVAATVLAVTVATDQAMAAPLGEGAIATLAFAGKLTGFILGVASLALSNVLLPVFSSRAAGDDPSSLHAAVRRVDRLVVSGGTVCSFAMVALSLPLTKILYGRGAVGADELERIAIIQRILVCQIPFYLGAIIHVRFLSAVRRNQLLIVIGVVNVIANFALNLVLRGVLGVAGIAWATVLMYVLSYSMMRWATHSTRLPERKVAV